MHHRIRFFITFALSCAALFSQQPAQRRAKIPTRSASPGTPNDTAQGKCTVQAKVDFAAQIEISGDIASISAPQGGEATIPVFECNAEIPRNAGDLRLMGADRQTRLTGRQRIGGPLVIEIENQSGGSKEHKFEIAWGSAPKDSSSSGGSNSTGVASPPASGVVPGSSSGQVALPMSRNAAEQATVRACQDAVACRGVENLHVLRHQSPERPHGESADLHFHAVLADLFHDVFAPRLRETAMVEVPAADAHGEQ